MNKINLCVGWHLKGKHSFPIQICHRKISKGNHVHTNKDMQIFPQASLGDTQGGNNNAIRKKETCKINTCFNYTIRRTYGSQTYRGHSTRGNNISRYNGV